MKTWITYIAALLMGLAAALLMSSIDLAYEIISSVSSFLVSFGMFITIPVVFISFASGTASLMKDRKGWKTAGMSFLWSVISALVLAFAACIIFIAEPEAFPVTSSAGSAPGTLSSHVYYMLSSSSSSLYPGNPFLTLATTIRFILPVVIVAWIFGLALKPSSDIIRPAYTTMNSFAEVMYRISRTYSVYGFFLTFFASASLFIGIYQEKTLFAAPEYAVLIVLALAAAVLIILPLLYGVFTGFKKNPYKVLLRAIAPALLAFSSSNSVCTIPVSESIARQNLGVQKRISSVTAPVFSIIGKGGSAFISTIILLSLYQATANEAPGTGVIAATALTAVLVSFISSFSMGTETALITVLTLNILGINLYGAENAIIAMLPLIGGLGAMVDSIISSYGSSIVATAIGTDIEIPYRDTI